jgi:hypothetical protein
MRIIFYIARKKIHFRRSGYSSIRIINGWRPRIAIFGWSNTCSSEPDGRNNECCNVSLQDPPSFSQIDGEIDGRGAGTPPFSTVMVERGPSRGCARRVFYSQTRTERWGKGTMLPNKTCIKSCGDFSHKHGPERYRTVLPNRREGTNGRPNS